MKIDAGLEPTPPGIDADAPEYDIPEGAVLIALTPGGLELAQSLKGALPGAAIHGLLDRAAPDDAGADVTFADVGRHVRELYAAKVPIVGICAAGILIRILAAVLGDKRAHAPVVSVAEDGSVAVPLLGGHGGANRLARAIAAQSGGTAAITTAGDVRLGLALDAPPRGWRAANPDAAKAVTAALLRGEKVTLVHDAGDAGWLVNSAATFSAGGKLTIHATDRAVTPSDRDLVLHPATLALGVGCERGVDAEELQSLAERALDGAGLAKGAVACVTSLDLKADEGAVHGLARALKVPARFFPAARLEAEAPRLKTPSDVVFQEVGCHGVAEGAALAAAGAQAQLVVAKVKSKRATCAIARAPHIIDARAVGQPRGRLYVVGIGPGDSQWRTPEADAALAEADDVVGYRLYLDLLGGAIAHAQRFDYDLGAERDRVIRALDLAAQGRTVALVSSGDAGIYALATLVFETLDEGDRGDWNRLAISVVPGISAMQAASARAGAPLGHDFCAISLSDLLTPWPTIEARLKAAAEGDFVLALYNPASKRRTTQLAAARDILLGARAPETPVLIARNLGRDGETTRVIKLCELKPDDADMTTLVVIGNSQTRRIPGHGQGWLYTPRGYAAKEPVA